MDQPEADIHFMKLALEQAKTAFRAGEVPVGAILVQEGRVIARAYNRKESSNDPTGHAEMLIMREAPGGADSWRLTRATLYVTKEPCIMCAGGMVNARLGRLVYGCRDEKGGAVDSLYHILSDQRLNHQVEVVSGILSDLCAEVLQNFFRERRQKNLS